MAGRLICNMFNNPRTRDLDVTSISVDSGLAVGK